VVGRRLRIWIVQNGEELPSDPGPPRLLRQALLAGLLASRGHEVTFWTPSFNHLQHRQRGQACDHLVSDGYRVVLLEARSYRHNVSMTRIRSHRDAAASFCRRSSRESPPDVILAGYPTIELAHAAVSYARERGVPTIVDFRDQWPDIWREALPSIARPLASPLIRHWKRLQRDIVRQATAVCGITDAFVDWALGAGERTRGPLDRAFHLAPPTTTVSKPDLLAAEAHWSNLLGVKQKGAVWGAYAGSLSSRTDILTVARATRLLPDEVRARLKVVVCGSGGDEEQLKRLAMDNDVLVYAGRRNAAEVRALLERADFGLIPYIGSSDFLMSYPNKLGEQLSYGLPILTGLEGVTGSLLREHRLSTAYRPGDPHSCATALSSMTATSPGDEATHSAKQLFLQAFNPHTIYPAYADHVERVASLVAGTGQRAP
jgi:glycosyltransferase involved in cell wall biosynthesis